MKKPEDEYTWADFRDVTKGFTAHDWAIVIWRSLPKIIWYVCVLATMWKVWR